jgi:hypothetical protein
MWIERGISNIHLLNGRFPLLSARLGFQTDACFVQKKETSLTNTRSPARNSWKKSSAPGR